MQAVRLFLPVALLMLTGCHTVRNLDDQMSSLAAESEAAATMVLTPADITALYGSMSAVEKSAGLPINPQALHSTKGRLDCVQDATVAGCGLKVRINGNLSTSQPVDADLAKRVTTFITTKRPDLLLKPLVVTDIVCDHIGPKVPPYNKDETRCKITNPRASNEVIIDGREAEEITGLLMLEGIDDATLSDSAMFGSLSCFQVDVGTRIRCNIRPAIRKVLLEKVVELDGRYTTNVHKTLVVGLRDKLGTAGEKVVLPNTITGSLTCFVDKRFAKTQGRRDYWCRVAL